MPAHLATVRIVLVWLCLLAWPDTVIWHSSEVGAAEPTNRNSIATIVTGADGERWVTFENDVQPLLTRYGCNAGACHGKSRGQNGFALSLLGFDGEFDHSSIVLDARGRRVSPAAPESSLLLTKAVATVPHGGGKRFEIDSLAYQTIRRWVELGAPQTPPDAPQLERVVLESSSVRLEPEQVQPLRVTALYSDGSHRDVTADTAFQSNDQALVAVDEDGVMTAGVLPGETAVMARYMNHIAVCTVMIPLPERVGPEVFAQLPRNDRLDELVWAKLQLLGVLPSDEADDATFHRRAYLRAIGRLPTPRETLDFLNSDSSDKRAQLIDQLLERPEYADFWANKWADLLRPNPYRVGIKAVWNLDAWLRNAFRENLAYDEFVRRLVTARGSTWHNGATVIFRDRPSTVEIGASVSQLFLGVRLECAKCHHHPFEVWSQDDFFGFASFFARVGHEGRISPPISGSEELIYVARKGELAHERTGEPVAPKTLTGQSLQIADDEDPREVLAEWMTAPDNPFFAKVMANRVWAELMGQGLVEPVDDLRATNPPTNEPLLDYLAEEFRSQGYDIKQLIRMIMNSRAFSLSSIPSVSNVTDTKNFSRYYRQRLRAEVLLDAINDILDTEEQLSAMPPGSRAMQLWTHRGASNFLDTFGRPDPNQDPPCERTSDSTTPQVLHMMNSPELNRKLSSDDGRPAQLAVSSLFPEEIIEDAYLRIYCRRPTPDEFKKASTVIFRLEEPVLGKAEEVKKQRRAAIEDLFWALLNTPEFLFVN